MTLHTLTAPEPPARITHHTVGRRAVLSVSGEIDVVTAPAFRRAIDDAIDAGNAELWIDLTATEFMDSTGIHALMEAHLRAEDLQRRLTIICPPGPVRRLFEITRLSVTLPLAVDRAAAHRDG